MSARCSQASADSTSQWEATPCGCAKPTRTAGGSSNNASQAFPVSPTYASSTLAVHRLTSWWAATPASPSQSPANAEEKTTPDISGPSSPVSFAFYDPASSSLRTSQGTFDLGFTPSLPTLPAWGWMSGGELYERPMSEPLTSGHGCSSLLPTPCSQEPGGTPERFLERKNRADGGNRQMENGNLSLTHTVALLPTPQGEMSHESGRKRDWGGDLTEALLPTPTREADYGGYNPDWGHGVTLADAARIVATGTAVPAGVSTPAPFTDGNTPSDDQPHRQLTIEAG